jgi:hypothetical protein
MCSFGVQTTQKNTIHTLSCQKDPKRFRTLVGHIHNQAQVGLHEAEGVLQNPSYMNHLAAREEEHLQKFATVHSLAIAVACLRLPPSNESLCCNMHASLPRPVSGSIESTRVLSPGTGAPQAQHARLSFCKSFHQSHSPTRLRLLMMKMTCRLWFRQIGS